MSRVHPYFFLCLVIFLLFGGISSFAFTQEEISVAVNGLNLPWLDLCCKYGTYLGDGYFALLIFLILLITNRPLAFTLLISYLIGTGLVQLLKQTVFSEWFRPIHALEFHPLVHFVEGVQMHRRFSFPSGHTTSAFLLAALFACHSRKNGVQVLLFLGALFVGFTRIYLLQHYLRDVLVGAITGTFFAWLGYHYLYQNEWLVRTFTKKH